MTFASVLNTTAFLGTAHGPGMTRGPSLAERLNVLESAPPMGTLDRVRRVVCEFARLAAQGTGHLVRRFGWAFADQLLSSGTNFLLGVLVARTVGVRDLGAFSVAYATFTFSLGGVRAIASELLIIRHSSLAEHEWRDGIRRSIGTALLVGIVIGTGCLVAATTLAGSVSSVLIIVGISLPLLLVQDVSRFALLARRRGAAALLSDAAWAGDVYCVRAFAGSRLCFCCVVHIQLGGRGVRGRIVGLLQLKVLPCGPITAVRWLRGHSDIAPRLFAEFAITTGVSMVTIFAIGGIAGLGELGRLQAAQIMLGPLNIMFSGVGLVATAEGVRLLRDSPKRLAHDCRWLSLALTMGVLAWGLIIGFVPRSIGEFVLRTIGTPAITAGAAADCLMCYAATFGASIGLHCLAAARRILRARH